MNKLYNKDCEKVADFLIDLTQHTDIEKDEPGKIILKVSLSAYKQFLEGVDGLDLSAILKRFNGIKKYDFSLFWRTIEIEYDTSVIERSLWNDLINSGKNEDEKQRVRKNLVNLLSAHS